MTANQIDYAKHTEIILHNRNTERQAANELAESQRHNLASEAEAQRHNAADEANVRFKVETEAATADKNRLNQKRIAQKDRKAENKRQAKKRANDLKIAKLNARTNVTTTKISTKGRTDAARISGQYQLQGTREKIDYDKWYATESPNADKVREEIDYTKEQSDYLNKKSTRERLDSMSQRHLNRAKEREAAANSEFKEAERALKEKDYENYYLKIDQAKADIKKAKNEAEKIAAQFGLDVYKTYTDAQIKAAGVLPRDWTAIVGYINSLRAAEQDFGMISANKDWFQNNVDGPKSSSTKSKSSNSTKSSSTKKQNPNVQKKFKHK